MEALHREKALLGHYATVRKGSIAFTLLPSDEENFEKKCTHVCLISNSLQSWSMFGTKAQLHNDDQFY